jgi:hypothetical protein
MNCEDDKKFVLKIYTNTHCEIVNHPYFADSFVIFFNKPLKDKWTMARFGKESKFQKIKLGTSYRTEKYAWFKARKRVEEIMIEILNQ